MKIIMECFGEREVVNTISKQIHLVLKSIVPALTILKTSMYNYIPFFCSSIL